MRYVNPSRDDPAGNAWWTVEADVLREAHEMFDGMREFNPFVNVIDGVDRYEILVVTRDATEDEVFYGASPGGQLWKRPDGKWFVTRRASTNKLTREFIHDLFAALGRGAWLPANEVVA